MRLKLNVQQVKDHLDRFAGAAHEAARPASQAAAQVFYDEARARAPVAPGPHIGKGGKVYEAGRLKASIYQVYSDQSSYGRAVYHISWNTKKTGIGHLLEFGHWQTHRPIFTKSGRWISTQKLDQPRWIPPRPFIRPAWEAKKGEADAAARAMYLQKLSAYLT